MTLWILMAALLLSPRLGRAGGAAYAVDERGGRFRVQFDPASAIRVGILSGVMRNSRGWGPAVEAQLLLGYRSILDFGKGDERISWQLDHRALSGWVRPWSERVAGVPQLDLLAYAGCYLRHTAVPYVMLPTEPPRRLFFPLDIGVEAQIGRVQVAHALRTTETMRVGVARAAVLFDPWRSGRPGNSLELGLGVSYDLDVVGTPDLADPMLVHRVAPLTAASVRFRYQDPPGLTHLDSRVDLVPHWASRGGWALGVEGRLTFERILLAINDEPLSLVVEMAYQRRPPTPDTNTIHDVRIVAGLAFGYQLRRQTRRRR